MRPGRGAAGPAESDARRARAGKVHLEHSSIFVNKLKVELERNQRIFSKCWGMYWLGGRDSNPDTQIQSLQSYH